MDTENKDKKTSNFVLSDMVKRKILDMYNISKDESTPKTTTEEPEATEKIEE